MTQAGQSKLRGLTSGDVVYAIAFCWMRCPSNSLEGKKGAGLGKCRPRDGGRGRPQLGLLVIFVPLSCTRGAEWQLPGLRWQGPLVLSH